MHRVTTFASATAAACIVTVLAAPAALAQTAEYTGTGDTEVLGTVGSNPEGTGSTGTGSGATGTGSGSTSNDAGTTAARTTRTSGAGASSLPFTGGEVVLIAAAGAAAVAAGSLLVVGGRRRVGAQR